MTNWTFRKKYSGQTPITYNSAGKKYNEANYLFNGIIGTVWTFRNKN